MKLMSETMLKTQEDLKSQINMQSENIVQLFNHVVMLNKQVYGAESMENPSQNIDKSQHMMLFKNDTFNKSQFEDEIKDKIGDHHTYRKNLDGISDDVDDDFSSLEDNHETEQQVPTKPFQPPLPHQKDIVNDVALPSDLSSPLKVQTEIGNQEFIAGSIQKYMAKSKSSPD